MGFEWPEGVHCRIEGADADARCVVCGKHMPFDPEVAEMQSAAGECFLCPEHGREHLVEWTSVSRLHFFSVW